MGTPRRQSCPLCSSERIIWQLYRVGGRRLGNVRRELHWSCRSCGHAWSASTSDDLETLELPPMPEISPTA
jgi:hypothetical protein